MDVQKTWANVPEEVVEEYSLDLNRVTVVFPYSSPSHSSVNSGVVTLGGLDPYCALSYVS